MDTGSPINLITQASFEKICKGNGCTGRVQESDTRISTVSGDELKVKGMVTLDLKLSASVSPISSKYYIVNCLAVPADVLMGIRTMRKAEIAVFPHQNGVVYEDEFIEAMSYPTRRRNRHQP